tara:strand:- start:346 stop:1143 length:798 start_codon:yes stop_codon:yes gene_type:complete
MAEGITILSDFFSCLRDGSIHVIDMAHPLGPNTPIIKVPEGHGKQPPTVSLEPIADYRKNPGFARWSTLTLAEHSGTHFDAPGHWFTGESYADGTTDTIAVDRFIAPACVVDFTEEVQENPSFVLKEKHLIEWEKKYGTIKKGSWVLFRSGWSKRFSDQEAFLNEVDGVYRSPGPDPSAVHLMLDRDICGYGTETIGTDHGNAGMFDPVFPAHNLMHGKNKFGMSSLNNLDKLPALGSLIIAAPLKIVDGSGSPLRVIGLVPKTG